jgi:hypothetical protein
MRVAYAAPTELEIFVSRSYNHAAPTELFPDGRSFRTSLRHYARTFFALKHGGDGVYYHLVWFKQYGASGAGRQGINTPFLN